MGLILKQWTVGVSVKMGILILKEGDTWYRKVSRSGFLCIDKSTNAGVAWDLNIVTVALDEDSIIIDIDNGETGYRHEVRDGAYCIDHVLTPTGFTGTENTDWENIYSTT